MPSSSRLKRAFLFSRYFLLRVSFHVETQIKKKLKTQIIDAYLEDQLRLRITALQQIIEPWEKMSNIKKSNNVGFIFWYFITAINEFIETQRTPNVSPRLRCTNTVM